MMSGWCTSVQVAPSEQDAHLCRSIIPINIVPAPHLISHCDDANMTGFSAKSAGIDEIGIAAVIVAGINCLFYQGR
jgi:hypothetical protein